MKTEKLIQLEIIQQRIFLIRGQKVMLSPHLAELYDIETRVLMSRWQRDQTQP